MLLCNFLIHIFVGEKVSYKIIFAPTSNFASAHVFLHIFVNLYYPTNMMYDNRECMNFKKQFSPIFIFQNIIIYQVFFITKVDRTIAKDHLRNLT